MAVGPALHGELGIQALSRGLPVFMEEPPAPTADAAERLADESRTSGKPCIVGFMKRYSTANRIAGNILRSGSFRSPASILGQYTTGPTYFQWRRRLYRLCCRNKLINSKWGSGGLTRPEACL